MVTGFETYKKPIIGSTVSIFWVAMFSFK